MRIAGIVIGAALAVATAPGGTRDATAQETVGTLFVPFDDPRKPKVVLAPAPRLPL